MKNEKIEIAKGIVKFVETVRKYEKEFIKNGLKEEIINECCAILGMKALELSSRSQ